jgi:hypothetical protein
MFHSSMFTQSMEHSSQLIKRYLAFYGNPRFINAITTATNCPILSHINPVHALHPTSWRPILILSSYLCLVISSGLFPSGLPTKTLYVSFHMRQICLHSRRKKRSVLNWIVIFSWLNLARIFRDCSSTLLLLFQIIWTSYIFEKFIGYFYIMTFIPHSGDEI